MRYGRVKPMRDRSTVHKGLNLFSTLAICSLLGVLIGAVCYLNYSEAFAALASDGELSELFEAAGSGFLQNRSDGDLSQILVKSLGVSAAFLAVQFLLGFGAVFQPLIFLTVFVRGMICGIELTGMYGSEFTKTSAIRAAAVLPGAFISLVAAVLAARESVCFSNKLFRICFQEGIVRAMPENGISAAPEGLLPKLKIYAVHFLIFLAACSVAAAADAALAVLLL